MTTKPTVKRFRVRRGDDGAQATADPAPQADDTPLQTPTAAEQIAAISREGLSARQLRTARRVALKHGFMASSDYDAVRQLRDAGIDPFQRATILDLVKGDGGGKTLPGRTNRLPIPDLRSEDTVALPDSNSQAILNRNTAEIVQIQRSIAARRKRKLLFLWARLAVFVLLPTALIGHYYYNIATPMYATNAEIVIQQAQPQQGGGTGLSTLFQGTSMATQQDSIAVQSYLASREAMLRLDADHGFKDHFSDPAIDRVQRLAPDATNEAAFKTYSDHVIISYDPTEGLIRMEVIAPDPVKSYEFSQALIGYAEEQVDQLTARLREDQMRGALQSYQEAEQRRAAALATWLAIQEDVRQIDPQSESSARMSQINTLEGEKQRLELVLQSRLNVDRPSEVQVQSLRDQIANIDVLIGDLRDQLVGVNSGQISLAARNTALRTAEENYTFQTAMVQQALTQMETARIEANRQVRYLSQSVRPVIPDAAAYPRAFENTIVAFLIFAGIYLMISITVSILREQVSS